MTALDDKLVPKALTMITNFGKNATFKVIAGADYDPLTGEVSQDGTSNIVRKIIPPMTYERKFIDGEIVQDGDLMTGIAASGLTFTPTDGMTVSFDNTSWKIVNVQPVYSGELIALYELQLRQ